jgi:hypothetical protein
MAVMKLQVPWIRLPVYLIMFFLLHMLQASGEMGKRSRTVGTFGFENRRPQSISRYNSEIHRERLRKPTQNLSWRRAKVSNRVLLNKSLLRSARYKTLYIPMHSFLSKWPRAGTRCSLVVFWSTNFKLPCRTIGWALLSYRTNNKVYTGQNTTSSNWRPTGYVQWRTGTYELSSGYCPYKNATILKQRGHIF